MAKLSSNGALSWNAFLGGTGNDAGYSVAMSSTGHIYVTGISAATWGAPVNAYSSGTDIFVAKVYDATTLIDLASFGATAKGDRIEIAWKTGSEIDNAGFNLLRADTQGLYLPVNAAFIPAEGSAYSGHDYLFEDHDILPGIGYSYKLEDLDLHGVATLHGPVTATAGKIVLLAPQDVETATLKAPESFSWDGGSMDRFRIEFSRSADFSGTVLSLPKSTAKQAKWIESAGYTPTAAEWNKIRALRGKTGLLYWRIHGDNAAGDAFTTEPLGLTVTK